MLIGYMVLAMLLAGHISAWPWLGLLFGIACRSFRGFYARHRLDAPTDVFAFQGPHRPRLRRSQTPPRPAPVESRPPH
jgi:hypothetical protein